MITSSRTYFRFLTHSARKYPIGYDNSTTTIETVSDTRIDFQNRLMYTEWPSRNLCHASSEISRGSVGRMWMPPMLYSAVNANGPEDGAVWRAAGEEGRGRGVGGVVGVATDAVQRDERHRHDEEQEEP